MSAKDRKGTIRAFLSIASALAFIFLIISGIALFIAPPCSAANALNWRFLFIGKESWEAIHLSFAFSFLILAPLHLLYNWSTFTSYFRRKAEKADKLSRPLLLALAAALALLLMSALGIPPVSWLHEAHEKIKFSWTGGRSPGDGFRGRGMRKFLNDHRENNIRYR